MRAAGVKFWLRAARSVPVEHARLQLARDDGLKGYERWQRMQRRADRLQSAFDRRECIEAALANDRYLALCASIARASALAESARADLVTMLETQTSIDGPS